MAAAKRKTPANRETSLRHVWLAGLGLAVVARRRASHARASVAERADDLRRRAVALVDDARANVVGGLDSVRDQVEPRVGRFSAEVESRLAPVLEKLGLDKLGQDRGKAKRPSRTPRKAAAGKRSGRAPAKQAQRRRRA